MTHPPRFRSTSIASEPKQHGYWQEVEAAYADCLRERMDLPDDELWAFAKERARRRRQRAFLAEKAEREGRNFLELLKRLVFRAEGLKLRDIRIVVGKNSI